jgi:hypothetical protein
LVQLELVVTGESVVAGHFNINTSLLLQDPCSARSSPCPRELPSPPLYELGLGVMVTGRNAADATGTVLRLVRHLPRSLSGEADAQLHKVRGSANSRSGQTISVHLSLGMKLWQPCQTLTVRALSGFGGTVSTDTYANTLDATLGGAALWQIGTSAGLRFDTRAVFNGEPTAEVGLSWFALW